MENTKLYKWSGAGNDFVVVDGRGKDVSAFRAPSVISRLCSEHSTDGLMILKESAGHDFSMEFYNPDGSGGMMCGNGGRCIAAFAAYLGVTGEHCVFEAPDGIHTADILSHEKDTLWEVRLGMVDVAGVKETLGGYFLETGTRHFVKFVPDVETVDVETEGRLYRMKPEFAPQGSNVNFVSVAHGGLRVRTFEKGVEGETLACGTGLTASAIAAFHCGIPPYRTGAAGRVEYHLQARIARLKVDFLPTGEDAFTGVFLTGPAELQGVFDYC